jgi:micrococcal nuclease
MGLALLIAMRVSFSKVALPLILLTTRSLFGGDLSCTVISVSDGDTLAARCGDRKVRVRLAGIDSPEKDQASGPAARRLTMDLALGKTVAVIEEDIDRYGRIVATVILPDGRNLNYEIVAAGWAWWYRKYYPYDSALRSTEADARKQRRGLWVDVSPVPPWEWRKQEHVPARLRKGVPSVGASGGMGDDRRGDASGEFCATVRVSTRRLVM